SIDIEDFRESVPTVTEANATELGAVCRDLSTSSVVDCDIANVYNLDMQSYFAGARVGADLVWGSRWFRGALSAQAGINALEYRSVDVRVGEFQVDDQNFRAFQSYAVGAQAMIFFPQVKIGLRGVMDYERYLRFDYPQGLQFKGPSTFDAENNRFFRPRVSVDDAELESWNFQIATFIAF
ncbi:MAG: hypothetical protein AAF658_11555, partial [Myxococcota bacterium]